MESIDDFLSKIQTNYAQKKQAKSDSPIISNPLDNLLDDFEAEFSGKKEADNLNKPKNELNNNIKDFVAEVKTNLEAKQQAKIQQKQNSESLLLEQLERKYQQKKTQKSEPLQPESIEQIKNKELDEQRKKKALTRQAEEWLKKLDPYSDEGIWFEEFSYSYESKLAAAIDYLEALRETKFSS